MRIAPTLVVEILSPSTARRDQTEKKSIYERNGVEEYWLVDPDEQSVTVFVLRGGLYDAGTAYRSGLVASVVLPALAIRVEEIFEA